MQAYFVGGQVLVADLRNSKPTVSDAKLPPGPAVCVPGQAIQMQNPASASFVDCMHTPHLIPIDRAVRQHLEVQSRLECGLVDQQCAATPGFLQPAAGP